LSWILCKIRKRELKGRRDRKKVKCKRKREPKEKRRPHGLTRGRDKKNGIRCSREKRGSIVPTKLNLITLEIR